MMVIYWIKHGGNQEKSHFSGRVSTSNTERSVLVTQVIFGFLFLEFGASGLATVRKGRTFCRGVGRRPECTRRGPAKINWNTKRKADTEYRK